MHRRVWKTPKAGNLARLSLQDEPLNELAHHQVRVQVRAVGLNFADIFALTGLYSATPKGAFTPGLEFSGVVLESHDPAFSVGDRVMGVTRFGGYASVIDSEPEYLTPLPDDWDFPMGAAYLVQTLTAYYALTELGALKPAARVLIHSAAGGVGLQAMKLVRAMGAFPVGTVSSEKKQTFLKAQGYTDVLLRRGSFSDTLAANNQSFDLVLDGVGGEVQMASFDWLAPMGRLVVFGAAEFTPGAKRPNYLKAAWKYLRRPKYDVMDMISENKSVMAFNLIWLWEQVDYLTQLISDMQTFEIAPPHVGHIFSFEEAPLAIECLRQGHSIGKVVLTLP